MSGKVHPPRNTIGNRLILSVGFIAGLAVSIGVIAFIIWEMLDDRVELLVDEKLPTLTTNYQLEHHTAQLHTWLNSVMNSQEQEALPELNKHFNDKFSLIHQLLNENPDQRDFAVIRHRYDNVQKNIDRLIELQDELLRCQVALNALDLQVFELNQQATSLLSQIQYEIDTRQPSAQFIANEYIQLQYLNQLQANLFIELNNAIKQSLSTNQPVDFAFSSLIVAVLERSERFAIYPSGDEYIATITALNELAGQEGEFLRVLSKIKEAKVERRYTYQLIRSRLEHIENLLLSSVKSVAEEMSVLNNIVSQIITGGNIVIFIMMCVTIFAAIFVAIDMISKGIVKRLNQLSNNLMVVNQGNLTQSVLIEGDDEIADIGQHLEHFRQQMVEMERTNALNLINHTQAALITCSTTGLILSINPSAMMLFGSNEPLQKVYLWQLFDQDILPRLRAIFAPDSSLIKRGAMTTTFQYQEENDEKYLRLDFRLFEQNRGQSVIITITDITEQEKTARWLEKMVQEKTHSLLENNAQLQREVEERRKTELELISTQNDLLQAAKMATVGQTMTSLAHELNQPLSAMSTYLFSCQLALENEQYDHVPNQLEKINAMLERISSQISNLRNFSKKNNDVATLTRVNASEATRQSWTIVESRARSAQVKLINNLPDGLHVIADLVQFEQVLVNLMVNSIDAISAKTDRSITVEEILTEQEITTIAVSDTGDGFSGDIINNLFTPFTTTKDVGLGLGLNICRSIMSRLQGNIYLASTLERGALVVLELERDDVD
ncbi:ATP-binding protein [Thaumasiovibrio subtropicus]|uniref:ATP-binding protein n=1 Tax=Thaumasiovibrio subtropicus TaxID=1891207 RepID=UPI000B35FFAE|nr:ATP-binding protein [Thaumasiovibrio subtropicus]